MRSVLITVLAGLALAGCIPIPVPVPVEPGEHADMPWPERAMVELGDRLMDWQREVEQPEFYGNVDAELEADARYFRLLRGGQRNLQVHPDLPPTDVPEKLHADPAGDDNYLPASARQAGDR